MKLSMKRIISLLLVVVMMVPILSSCGLLDLFGKGPDNSDAGLTTSPTTTADPTPVFDRVAINGLSEYVIVYPEIASDAVYEAVLALRDAIRDVTGIELAVKSDLPELGEPVPTDTKEILVGATNRYESSGTPSLRYDDYYVAFENSRLALMGGSDDAVVAAVGFAIDYLLAEGTLGYADGGYLYAAKYPLSSMTLAGRSIADFVIVRDAENATLASYLAESIRKATGFVLPIRTVEDPETAYEILIGNTGRNATSTPLTEKKYIIDVVGTKLVLYGTGENASYYATLRFINKYLDGKQSVLAVTREEFDNSASGIYHLNLPSELGTIELEYQENSGGVLERFMKAKDELPEEITVVERITLAQYPFSARRTEVYISPDGSDENTGTKTAPFATLKKALEVVGRGGGVIWVRGGTYEFDEAVTITDTNSGTSTSPLFIKAYGDETPIFTTYKSIKLEWFKEMTLEDPMIDRLDSSLNVSDIYTVSLRDYGFTLDDLTELVSDSDAYSRTGTTYDEDYAKYEKNLALYEKGEISEKPKAPVYSDYRSTKYGVRPMILIGDTEYELCRYPNADEPLLSYAYAYDTGRVTSSTGSEIYYDWINRCKETQMDYYTPLPWIITLGTRNRTQMDKGVRCEDTAEWERYAPILDWIDTGNIWFYGRPYSDWSISMCNVRVGQQVDENGNLLGEVAHYGSNKNDYAIISTMPVSLGARTTSAAQYQHDFYLFNAFEAIDIPGEWFIDVESEDLRLYICPTDDFFRQKEITYTGSYNGSIISMPGNVSNVVIDGITFSGVGASGIHRSGVASSKIANVVVQDCTFKHTANTGVTFSGGAFDHVAVIYNDFSQSHGSMLSVTNNQAYNLIPDHNAIQNNTFHDPTPNHQGAIGFQGCRSVVSHNYLINTNISIGGPGYENIVEYNLCVGGSEDVGDGGQIYMYGLYTRGNHIRNNVLHGLNFSGNNLYNDGMCSGNYSYYNICSTLTGYRTSGQKCFYVSTGHNNVAFNNIFITRPYERVISNLELHGTTANQSNFEYFNHETGKKESTKRVIGDSVMYESTLFYADTSDKGYGTRSDSASYSWDELYMRAAKIYTVPGTNAYIDLEKMEQRFPNFIASMRGAAALFVKMGYETLDFSNHKDVGYDRRTDVVAMEAVYDARVAELKAEGYSDLEANNQAFKEGLAYNEDFFRQPAYNLYKNNIATGSDRDYYFDTDSDGIYGENRGDYVYSDYLGNRAGIDDFGHALAASGDPFAKDMRIIENNYYYYDYNEIFWDADPDYIDPWYYYPDYGFLDGVEDDILAAIPDYFDLLYVSIRAGVTR